jgi:hypothetical protein
MYSQLSIAILIDVEAALRHGRLDGYIHVLDNALEHGATPGTTVIVGNQIANWLVRGIDWKSPVYYAAIKEVKGEAVDKQILVPRIFDSPSLAGNGYWWGGTVDARFPGVYGYTLSIDLGGTLTLDWPLHLDVRTGFIMSEPPGAVASTGEPPKTP